MKTAAFSKTYGGRTVLRLPELELNAGTVTAVIGANGSGKSTMARVLANIEAADGGTKPLQGVSVGYMPQKSYAFRMSVEKNIALGGQDRERARHLTEALGLAGLERRRAQKLSGGETAKMALARLLMGAYELLILDEPTASMDMGSTLAAETLMKEACRDRGCALLLITHSVQQARRAADRVLFLDGGELAEAGETGQVLTAPQDPRTRRFLEFYGL